MKEQRRKLVKVVSIAALHLFIVSLSVSCGREDSTSHSVYLEVPTSGEYIDSRELEFFLDEEVVDGVMTGWVQGSGCRAWVDLCYDGECDTVFYHDLDADEEVMFEVYSDESMVFSEFLDDYVPCYKEHEFGQEPFSCQKWKCDDSKDDILVVLESECPTSLTAELEVNYFDERTPFKGPINALEFCAD